MSEGSKRKRHKEMNWSGRGKRRERECSEETLEKNE
jgi:hypothetical protein